MVVGAVIAVVSFLIGFFYGVWWKRNEKDDRPREIARTVYTYQLLTPSIKDSSKAKSARIKGSPLKGDK